MRPVSFRTIRIVCACASLMKTCSRLLPSRKAQNVMREAVKTQLRKSIEIDQKRRWKSLKNHKLVHNTMVSFGLPHYHMFANVR